MSGGSAQKVGSPSLWAAVPPGRRSKPGPGTWGWGLRRNEMCFKLPIKLCPPGEKAGSELRTCAALDVILIKYV